MADDFKRVGHLNDKWWSGRKHRKAGKAKARAALKRELKKDNDSARSKRRWLGQ